MTSSVSVTRTENPPAATDCSNNCSAEEKAAPHQEMAEPRLTVIEPQAGWGFLDFKEIWRYRELLGFLIWRDVKVRYKQTVLGAAWAVLQPLATMLVFTLFLGNAVRDKDPDAVPYPLFVYCGMLLWMSFSNAIVGASNSVVASQQLITKVYFPRILVPLGAVGTVAVDLAVGSAILFVLMTGYSLAGYPVSVGWKLLLAPLFILVMGVAATGLGTLLAALTVSYRDFRHVVPFAVQLWLFATPSIFVQEGMVFGPRGQLALCLNPVHGLIVNFRAAVFNQPFDSPALGTAVALSLVLLLIGGVYFRRTERDFADII
jgi:lipopolysaccharide transport system permease protein